MSAKIGCYLRVSTTDKQTTKSQREAIRRWASAHHVRTDAIRWYEDRKSGATTERPELARLLRDIDKGKIDGVVVYKLDRLSRSLQDGISMLGALADKGIRVVSVSENIDFSNSVGRLIASVLFSVACFSREQTIERIRAGVAAAKASGKHCGRPRDEKRLNQIREWFEGGMSAIEIAERLKCSRANVYSALAKTRQESAA